MGIIDKIIVNVALNFVNDILIGTRFSIKVTIKMERKKYYTISTTVV